MDSSKDKFALAGALAATDDIGMTEGAGAAGEFALAAETASPRERSLGPRAVYLPACGVLCDIFWWARR
jgi:hypothetical protein